jgi:hypothetical protein
MSGFPIIKKRLSFIWWLIDNTGKKMLNEKRAGVKNEKGNVLGIMPWNGEEFLISSIPLVLK